MEKELALGIINKFKTIENPGSIELIAIPLIFKELEKPLKKYFKTLSTRGAQDVKMQIIDTNGYDGYTQHYLQVMGAIARVFGVSIYMSERLEYDTVMTVKRLLIVGQKSETSIVTYLAKYLLRNEKKITKRVRVDKPKDMNPNAWNKEVRKKLYIPIYQTLITPELQYLKTNTVPVETLKLKSKCVLEFLLNNLKFDFNDRINNPLYTEHDELSNLDKFRIFDGKWKNKHLLWAKGTNN